MRWVGCLLAVGACADAQVGDTDTDVAVDTDPLPLGDCPAFLEPASAGTVADDALTEISGLVASRAFPGTLWVHNDSGAGAVVYALDGTGAGQAKATLDGVVAADWEDLAIAPRGDSGWDLLVGDIGDNARLRPHVTVWRFAEPDPAAGDASVSDAEELTFTFPDGPHDCESMFVDPVTGDLFFVAKQLGGTDDTDGEPGGSGVYRAAAPFSGTVALEHVGALPFGTPALPGDGLATGADIAPDGAAILVRTYFSAFLWRRPADRTVAAALATEPCVVPLAIEPQGESIAWRADGAGYVTISEDPHPTVWTYAAE